MNIFIKKEKNQKKLKLLYLAYEEFWLPLRNWQHCSQHFISEKIWCFPTDSSTPAPSPLSCSHSPPSLASPLLSWPQALKRFKNHLNHISWLFIN